MRMSLKDLRGSTPKQTKPGLGSWAAGLWSLGVGFWAIVGFYVFELGGTGFRLGAGVWDFGVLGLEPRKFRFHVLVYCKTELCLLGGCQN